LLVCSCGHLPDGVPINGDGPMGDGVAGSDTLGDGTQPCPASFTKVNLHYYRMISGPDVWSAQVNDCEASSPQAHLAVPVDMTMVIEIGTSVSGTSVPEVWLGITDVTTEGTYRSADGSEVVSYLPWASGEPNGGTNQNCVSMHVVAPTGYFDEPCGMSLDAVCECLPK